MLITELVKHEESLGSRLMDPDMWRGLDRFFEDPDIGTEVLHLNTFGPFTRGPACANIRQALIQLGYALQPGDCYDEALSDAVKSLQIANKHQNKDGKCGRGTRRLLALRLLETEIGPRGFAFADSRVDPKDPPKLTRQFPAYDVGEKKAFLFASYAHKDSHVVNPEITRLHSCGYRIGTMKGLSPGQSGPARSTVQSANVQRSWSFSHSELWTPIMCVTKLMLRSRCQIDRSCRSTFGQHNYPLPLPRRSAISRQFSLSRWTRNDTKKNSTKA